MTYMTRTTRDHKKKTLRREGGGERKKDKVLVLAEKSGWDEGKTRTCWNQRPSPGKPSKRNKDAQGAEKLPECMKKSVLNGWKVTQVTRQTLFKDLRSS